MLNQAELVAVLSNRLLPITPTNLKTLLPDATDQELGDALASLITQGRVERLLATGSPAPHPVDLIVKADSTFGWAYRLILRTIA